MKSDETSNLTQLLISRPELGEESDTTLGFTESSKICSRQAFKVVQGKELWILPHIWALKLTSCVTLSKPLVHFDLFSIPITSGSLS